jgi:hypothetical protein
MRKFIAIQDAVHDQPTSASLKQSALIFDRIYLIELEKFIDSLYNYKHGDSFKINLEDMTVKRIEKDANELKLFASELEWLMSNGIIADASEISLDDEYKRMIELQDDAELQNVLAPNGLIGTEEMEKLGLHMARAWLRRAWAMYMSCYKRGEDVTCFLPLSGLMNDFDRGVCDVAHIVLSSVPVPRADAPWEQINEFRQDEDSRLRLFDLRSWMRKMTTQAATARELENEVEALLHNYERHMRVHKMKCDPGVLETIVTMAPTLVQNMLTLKFGEAAKALFTAKHRKIALLEAELTAPGKELAYISQAANEFA